MGSVINHIKGTTMSAKSNSLQLYSKGSVKHMIEHSITKYTAKLPPVVVVPPSVNAYNNMYNAARSCHWTHEKCMEHMEHLKHRGFAGEALISTKWGRKGRFDGFMDIHPEGITFYGTQSPDVIKMACVDGSIMYYNEQEITEVNPIISEGAMTC